MATASSPPLAPAPELIAGLPPLAARTELACPLESTPLAPLAVAPDPEPSAPLLPPLLPPPAWAELLFGGLAAECGVLDGVPGRRAVAGVVPIPCRAATIAPSGAASRQSAVCCSW